MSCQPKAEPFVFVACVAGLDPAGRDFVDPLSVGTKECPRQMIEVTERRRFDTQEVANSCLYDRRVRARYGEAVYHC